MCRGFMRPTVFLSTLLEVFDKYQDERIHARAAKHKSFAKDAVEGKIQAFRDELDRFEKKDTSATAADFVQSASLKAPRDNVRVLVSTIHMVKGSEFPVVCIPSWSQDSFAAKDDDHARLAYVAVSRAQYLLKLTYSDVRCSYIMPGPGNAIETDERRVALPRKRPMEPGEADE
eukprot:TRINITY_DN1381_c0_g1_i13.p1 TRINITY_DN1381_c0_g1~~TRINITY_DN1381_c0_g1_i13.p1  ORF type:complete len:174 (-),score=13.72 TRINITY_DN1381_c0_g1_i13:43-564(-)